MHANKKNNWRNARMRCFMIGFIFFNTLVCILFMDTWSSANPTSRILPVLTFFEEGSLRIDTYQHMTTDKSFVNGHYYSDKAPLSTFIVIPFYGLLKFLKLDQLSQASYKGSTVAIIGDLLCGTLPFVLMMTFSFYSIAKKSKTLFPVLLCTCSWYGSFLFAYTGAFFGHLLAAFFLLSAYILLKKTRYFWAGFLLGLSILTEYPIGIVLPIWALQIFLNEKKWQKTALFIAGSLPMLLVVFIYNYAITDIPFKMIYSFVAEQSFKQMQTNYGLGVPSAEALWGLLFSPFRGLFFYSPVLLVFLLILWKNRKTALTHVHLERSYLLTLCLSHLFLFSGYYMWWGGWCYGPRHFIPMTAVLIYEGVKLLANYPFSKRVFYSLAGIGFLMCWLDHSTRSYDLPSDYKFPVFDPILKDFFMGNLNTNNLLSLFDLGPHWAVFLLPCFSFFIIYGLHQWYNQKQLA